MVRTSAAQWPGGTPAGEDRAAAKRAAQIHIRFSEAVICGLIVAVVLALHLPQDDFANKWLYVGVCVAGLGLYALRYFLDASHWGFVLLVAAVLGGWILFVYWHGMSHPPGTEYAYNKYPYFVLVATLGIVLIPAAVSANNGWRALVVALILAGIILSLVSFFPALAGTNARKNVLGLNPVMLAKVAAVPIIVAICFSNLSTYWKSFVWPIALLSVAACVNTGSRTPLLAIAIAYFVSLMLRAKVKELFRSAGVYVLLATIFFLYLSIATPEIAERFSLEMLSREGEMRTGDRLFLQNLAIDVTRENPMGIGFGNFSTVFWINAPHNIYLEALVELGIIGLVPLLALTWLGMRASFRLLRSSDPMGQFFGIFFLYAFITSLVGNELTLPALLFYLSLGSVVAYDRLGAADRTSAADAGRKGAVRARRHPPPAAAF